MKNLEDRLGQISNEINEIINLSIDSKLKNGLIFLYEDDENDYDFTDDILNRN